MSRDYAAERAALKAELDELEDGHRRHYRIEKVIAVIADLKPSEVDALRHRIEARILEIITALDDLDTDERYDSNPYWGDW